MPYLTATPLELTETVRRLADLLMFTRTNGGPHGPHSIAADRTHGCSPQGGRLDLRIRAAFSLRPRSGGE